MNIRHDKSSSSNRRQEFEAYNKASLVSKERSSRPTSKQAGVKSMTTPRALMKHWKCNLCNIELPNDELADIRKERHRKFHIDESAGTTNRQRNWTFGKVNYVLT